jgi:hypothetical protein
LILVGARELNNACASVLIAINCTPARPHSIILFTALFQPPPTHTTVILATGEIEAEIFTSSGPVDSTGAEPDNRLFSLSSLIDICLILKIINNNYGSSFLKVFSIDSNNPEIFIVNIFDGTEYLFERIIVPITLANTGSEIEASEKSSCDTGSPINTGNFNDFFHKSTNHLIFVHPHTQIAHSGNIPSLQIFFNSSRTK